MATTNISKKDANDVHRFEVYKKLEREAALNRLRLAPAKRRWLAMTLRDIFPMLRLSVRRRRLKTSP